MDKKHGNGIYTWADGQSYSGAWQNGKQHGVGEQTFSNGSKRKGIWENGKRISWIDK